MFFIGEDGIRTHEGIPLDLQSNAFNHSATAPSRNTQ